MVIKLSEGKCLIRGSYKLKGKNKNQTKTRANEASYSTEKVPQKWEAAWDGTERPIRGLKPREFWKKDLTTSMGATCSLCSQTFNRLLLAQHSDSQSHHVTSWPPSLSPPPATRPTQMFWKPLPLQGHCLALPSVWNALPGVSACLFSHGLCISVTFSASLSLTTLFNV